MRFQSGFVVEFFSTLRTLKQRVAHVKTQMRAEYDFRAERFAARGAGVFIFREMYVFLRVHRRFGVGRVFTDAIFRNRCNFLLYF